jgi:hypothetical protein
VKDDQSMFVSGGGGGVPVISETERSCSREQDEEESREAAGNQQSRFRRCLVVVADNRMWPAVSRLQHEGYCVSAGHDESSPLLGMAVSIIHRALLGFLKVIGTYLAAALCFLGPFLYSLHTGQKCSKFGVLRDVS